MRVVLAAISARENRGKCCLYCVEHGDVGCDGCGERG